MTGYVTPTQLASMCKAAGVKPSTRQHIAKLCKTGEIRAERIGNGWAIPKEAAMRFIADKKNAE